MQKSFSQRLKKLRNDKELSQAKLANILNVAQQTVNKWEHEDGEPDIKMLIRLSNFFDVTLDYLCGSSDEIIKPNKAPKSDMSGAYAEPRKKAVG
jgi:transcriptional regulator with XRE-family HTH domain